MNFDLVTLGPPRRRLGECAGWPCIPRRGESLYLAMPGGEVRLDVSDVLYRAEGMGGPVTIEVMVWIPDAAAEARLG